MSTVLLVEDNPHIMKINAEYLTLKGYEIVKADTVASAREVLFWNTVDIVVLDIMLPDGSGLDFCKEIKEKYKLPILFLSALGTNKDIVEGLRIGGDDYLAKPYDLEVLEAHIEARLRQNKELFRYVCFGSLKLDILTASGYIQNEDMLLTQKEFSVLLLLAKNAETVVSKEKIMKEVWNTDTKLETNTLWTLISRLRSKLQSEKSRITISSKRESGYILEQI